MNIGLYELETVPDAAGDAGGAPPPDTGADAPVDAPAAWGGPSQDEWNQMMGAVQALAQLEQRRASVYQPQQGQQTPAADFWDDPDQWLEQRLASRLQPYEQVNFEVRQAQFEDAIEGLFEQERNANGDFDADMAALRLQQRAVELAPRFGGDLWQATQAAVPEVAKAQRDYEQQQRERYVNEYTGQLQTLAGAAHEPGSQYAVGTQQRTVPDYRQGGTVTSRFFGPRAEQ